MDPEKDDWKNEWRASQNAARAEAMSPVDFELVDDSGFPAIGSAIIERWKASESYRPDVSEEEQAFMLDQFLKWMFCRTTSVNLSPTGRYASVEVKWVPGHLVNDRLGYGPREADIMLIGKTPTKNEVQSGRYWTGSAAGKLLAKELGARGIDITSCYGTYLNKFDAPYPNMKTIPAAWTKEGLWFLQQEIRIVKPKFILMLGADVLKAVVGRKATVRQYRGVVIDVAGTQAMVTNNPADLVRNPEHMDSFRQDLNRFASVVTGKDIRPTDVEYHYLRNEEQLKAAIELCKDSTHFSLDCEWAGKTHLEGHLLTIQFSRRAKESFVVVLRSDVRQTEFWPSPSAAIPPLRELLMRKGVSVIGHNLRADMKWLMDLGLDVRKQYAIDGFDTMLAHHLISETDKHNLTDCALNDTDMGRYDADMEQWKAAGYIHWTVPEDVLLPYAAGDSDATFRLYEKYRDILWKDHCELCEKAGVDPKEAECSPAQARAAGKPWLASRWNLLKFIVLPVNIPIAEMEMVGVHADPDRILEMSKIFARKRDDMLAEIRSIIHEPDFNPRSSPQVARLLFGKPGAECRDGVVHTALGFTPVKTTGKRSKMWVECMAEDEVYYLDEPVYEERDGKMEMIKEAGWNSDFHSPSTDTETLAVLADEQNCQEAELLRNFRFLDQICKNFLALPETVNGEQVFMSGLGGALKRDGRIHTNFSQLTDTGRYRSFDPNMQNLPKGREGDLAKLFRVDEEVPPVRTCIMATPGHVLLEADFESAELYTLAWIAKDQRMKDDLERTNSKGKKISLHTTQAINIFRLNMSPEEFDKARKGEGPEAKKLEGLRIAAKSVNFGIPYQRGAKAIARQVQREGVDCTAGDAQEWIDAFYDNYKDVAAYLQFCKDSVWSPGWLRTPYGRMRHFHESEDDAAMAAQEREACNFPCRRIGEVKRGEFRESRLAS